MWERYAASETFACLTWLRGTIEETIRGQVLEIGGGGVALAVEDRPPLDATIRLRIETQGGLAHKPEPAEARLVGISRAETGSGLILHMQWVGPCPIEFFELAVHGA